MASSARIHYRVVRRPKRHKTVELTVEGTVPNLGPTGIGSSRFPCIRHVMDVEPSGRSVHTGFQPVKARSQTLVQPG